MAIKNSGLRDFISICICCHFSTVAIAEDNYSPYSDQTYPSNVYWGDTHLHTNLSADANITGNKNLSPVDAYRFALGEVVTTNNGTPVQLRRPLDYLVIADHAEEMGVIAGLQQSNPALLNTDVGQRLNRIYQKHKKRLSESTLGETYGIELFATALKKKNTEFNRSVWHTVTSTADHYNRPGIFTAFSGYEWTSLKREESFANLHRVVIFKDGADKVSQVLPLSVRTTYDPEDLWRYFEAYQQKTGGEVLAIPHNSNLSNGQMFSLTNYRGEPLTQDYAKTRSRWEPLLEVTQIKGDSETHPILSPTDEFADFETWNNWYGDSMEEIKTEGWEEKKRSEYARSALKLGLDQQAKLGVNPFKFGMIGSTDAHNSMPAVDENSFLGKFVNDAPSPDRMYKKVLPSIFPKLINWTSSASGYAAVWAEENTRDALFAAMKRKEVYATTGPRMVVRFFGGWDYNVEDALRPDFSRIGYSKGVPMGGDLTHAPKGKPPNFLIRAVKDPDGANLDRVQVIKGWRDKKGELSEKIYNIALSDGRKENRMGKVPVVGSTVDVNDASYNNSIGDPELAVVWVDPDFDKDQLAFYYVRVLEIPTPRWTAYDAKFFGLKNIPKKVPMVIQERAYTSPIWYSPSS